MRSNLSVVETPKPELSAGRQALAQLLETDASLGEQCADKSSTIDRLRGPIDDESAALVALTELSNIEADAMAEWARGGDGSDHPRPDVGKHRELAEAYETAAGAATAARSATIVITAELAALAQQRVGMAPAIKAAIYQVMVDELEPVMSDLRDAEQKFLAQLARATSLGDLFVGNATQFDDPSDPERILLLRHLTTLKEAVAPFYVEPRPTGADIQAKASAWIDLALHLSSDPTATLGA